MQPHLVCCLKLLLFLQTHLICIWLHKINMRLKSSETEREINQGGERERERERERRWGRGFVWVHPFTPSFRSPWCLTPHLCSPSTFSAASSCQSIILSFLPVLPVRPPQPDKHTLQCTGTFIHMLNKLVFSGKSRYFCDTVTCC